MFQIIRMELDHHGRVLARRPLNPVFALRSDALVIAEFDASRVPGDYGYDEEQDCWWALDTYGHSYRFVVEQVAPADSGGCPTPCNAA
jgi:hypothetical protein